MQDDLFTPLDLAIHRTVKGYVDPHTGHRGAVALSAKVGMPSGTLSNKASPQIPEAKLGLIESVPVQLVANDFQILHTYNAALGHCAYRMPIAPVVSDMAVLDAYLDVHATTGKKAMAIRAALQDGKVTRAELDDIKALFDDRVRAGLELIACLERLVVA